MVISLQEVLGDRGMDTHSLLTESEVIALCLKKIEAWHGVNKLDINSLTPIDGHDHQIFNELHCSLVTSTIFVRC
jgi:hypothetical protein